MAFRRLSHALRGAYLAVIQSLTCKKHGRRKTTMEGFGYTPTPSNWIATDLDNMQALTDATVKPPATPPAAPLKQLYFTEGDCMVCTEPASETNILVAACQYDCKWCKDSLVTLFQRATERASEMPPRCCGVMIPLHYALPYLTDEEAAKFRLAFEEWATPGSERLYCPTPECRKFIPLRAIQRDGVGRSTVQKLTTDDMKAKRDSAQDGISTASAPSAEPAKQVICPSCTTSVCTGCGSTTHGSDQECLRQVDEVLTAQLIRWKYKPCPRCGHYIRRMHGCNHMMCICGEHICWGCGVRYQDCENYGECDTDGEDAESMTGSADYTFEDDLEEDRDDGTVHTEQAAEEQTQNANATDDFEASYEAYLRERQAVESGLDSDETTTPAAAPRPRRLIRRDRDLDRGTHAHWAEQGMNFGDEPGDDDHTMVMWDGYHHWQGVEKPKDVTGERHMQIECHICWKVVVASQAVVVDEQPMDEKKAKKKRSNYEAEMARQCRSCRLVVCRVCRDTISL